MNLIYYDRIMVDKFSGFPLDELSDRSKKASEAAAEAGLDGLLILQDCDLYYFTSTAQTGALFIPKEGEGVFFVTKDFERAKAESSLPNIVPIKSLKELPKA